MTTISDRAKKNGLRSSFGMFAQALFRFFTLSQSLNDEKRRVPVPHEGLGVGAQQVPLRLGERVPVPHEGLGVILSEMSDADLLGFPFPMRG